MGNTPDAGTDGTLDICSDGTPIDLFTALGGTPTAGYVWQDPSGNPIAMPYDPVTYVEGVYTYVADDGGCIATATVTVTEFTVTPVANNTSSNCGTDCTGQIGLAPTDGFGAYEYSIDNGANWQAAALFEDLCTGDYTITIRDDLGCMASINQSIDTINIPEIDRAALLASISNVTCNSADDGSITIPFVNAVNFSIDGGLTTQASPTFNNLTPGNYQIVIDNGFGCDDKNVVFVISEPLPITIENISADQVVCVDGPVWVTVGAQGGAPGATGSPEYIYEWTENGTVISTEREFTWHNSPVGGATYCVTVSEACGSPVATECFEVTNHVVINPNFSIDPHDGCFPVEASFYNLSNDAGSIAKIDWDFGDGTVQSVLAPLAVFPGATVSHSYNDEGVYDVSMSITSVNGCKSDTVFIDTVRAYGYPNANFSNEPSSPTMYDANTTYIDNSSPDVVAWEWDFGSLAKPTSSNSQTPGLVVYPDAVFGTYTTTLWVTNEHGCRDSIEYNVIVQSEVLIYAPNSFTPDGDIYNEEWKVHLNGIDVYDFDLFIYNRWGETVWESHDASVGWDGKYGGKIVPDGTYIWIIRTKDLEDDEKYTWNGTITVLR
jgi:gliding motility-associated-like protein